METIIWVLLGFLVAIYLGWSTMHRVGGRPWRPSTRVLGFVLLVAIVTGAVWLFRTIV